MLVLMLVAVLTLLISCAKLAPPQPPDNVVDTTSHNFTWQITVLGNGLSSSMLNDVAIINDTLVYAVGEIYLKDSTGQEDINPYNLVRGNGSAWTIVRAPYYYQGQPHYQRIQLTRPRCVCQC